MGTLDAVQQEQLSAIGTYLSQVRQEQERSLEDIAAKTYIPLRLLKAIESGQGQPLPEPVFVQGFIRRYADALGLDGMDLSQRFPVHVTPLPIATAVAAAPEPARSYGGPSYARPAPVAEDELPTRVQPRQPRSYLPYAAAAGLLLVTGVALALVNRISSRPPRTDSATVLPQQPVPPSPAYSVPSVQPSAPSSPASPAATTSPKPAPSAASPKAAPSPNSANNPASSAPGSSQARASDPVRAEMQLSGESWVRVTVDGVVKAEAVLPRGTRQSWSGKKEIVIESGNAGAVAVSTNGSAAKPMGELGAVEELTVRPQAGGATP